MFNSPHINTISKVEIKQEPKKNQKPYLVVPQQLVKELKKFYGNAVDVYESKPVKLTKDD